MGEYAGRWVRVSSGGQDEANQVPDVNRWIDERGYEVTANYVLHGRSASKGEQQAAIDTMLADMRAGLITVLVVWRDDRIERRGVLAMVPLINAVKAAGGRIEFVTQPHLNDLSTMAGRISLAVMAEVAHAETETKKERVRMGRDRIKTEGGFSGRPPWGYEVTGPKYGKAIVPTAEGRELIPEVYRRVIAGDSLATIGAWLAGQTGHAWHPRTVGGMVRNRAYMGHATNGAGQTVHRCEALVTAATFKQAGEELAGRPKRGHIDPAKRAMLSGVLTCPDCADSPMYRLNTGYYRCTGRGAARRGCGNMVGADKVDAAVDRIIAARFAKPVMAYTVTPGNEAELAARLEEIRFELSQLGAADLDDAEYDARLAGLRAERDEVKSAVVVPARVQEAETGELYSELWARTPVADRGPWLAHHHFTVTASKTRVTVTRQGREWAWDTP
jgi:DNA invertase Pin-like site-specific DNA recombinase